MASGTAQARKAVEAQTQFIDVDSVKIAYREVGAGEPLVLISRFRASMDDWDPAFVDALAATRRVILFDSAGVGESEGETPTSLEGAAKIATAFTRMIAVTKADFLGWSMGGMTAQILALEHPEVVRSIILSGTLPPGGSPEVVPSSKEWSTVAAKPEYNDEDILYLFFTKTKKSRAAGQASLDRIGVRKGGSGSKVLTLPSAMGSQYQAIMGFYQNQTDTYARLKDIKVPTLVANGDLDGAFPVIDSVVLAREIPDAQLVIYPDSGHGFLFQYPERFAQDVTDFLDGL